MNPKWPVCIPSKGRSDTRMTMKLFDHLGVPYTIFIEAQELDAYSAHFIDDQIHVMPHRDKGLCFTRNYIWDQMAAAGYEYFWTFDDNIKCIYRLNHNRKTRVADGTALAVIEDFAHRYDNAPICGMNYQFFVKQTHVRRPFSLNRRVYSNMLIQTFATDSQGEPFRNVTFYNDDTDLCLRVLKSRLCTVLFNSLLIDKAHTMTVKGGMTEIYEATDNRLEFAEELQQAHPDVVRVTHKFQRTHHEVDYSGFQHQLHRKPGIAIPDGINNFGMVLQERIELGWKDIDDRRA